MADEATPVCPSEKPGIKTTEFWLALAMMVVGAWLISKGKDEVGGVLTLAAGSVYTGFRGLVKSKLAQAGAVLLLVFAVGCGTPGYVKASEIQGLVHAVCDRHKRLVAQDPSYVGPFAEQKRQSDIRSGDILVGTVDEAVKAGEEKK